MCSRGDICRLVLGAAAAGLAFATALAAPGHATERGGINLGGTSFFDGFARLEPGCTAVSYTGHDAYTQLNGPDGAKLPAPAGDTSLDISYEVLQLACNSPWTLLGGSVGWNTLMPLAGDDSNALTTNGMGLGDITTGPYIQFPPVMRNGRPVFSHGFEVDLIAPSGKYDADTAINPGNGYWSVNPFWKATLLPAPQWEISWRVNYIRNFDHQHEVNVAGAGGLALKHNGDGVWVNFTASRELAKDFYFGLNGYWLKQLSGDTLQTGEKLNNEQASLYLGPGFHYKYDSQNIFNFNVYLPVRDENAFSGGVQVNLQYIHPLH